MKVPFVDLKAQYDAIKADIDEAISDVITATNFIGGVQVSQFEKEFSKYIGIEHCIACANGTDAIEMALSALGIGAGDEVIVPAISWISTAEVVNTVGADPIFVDLIEREYTIDPKQVEDAITDNTKAIIPVHLYGAPARMHEVLAIAKKYDLYVIEDCAQAHQAQINGQNVGTFGDIATFSFYPGKNLGAYGDAGGVVTNDPHLAEKVKMIGNHGQLKKHDHRLLGRNSRMDTLQASILRAKLPYLNDWTVSRNQVALWYGRYLKEEIVKPKSIEGFEHAYHLYVIRTKHREVLTRAFDEHGIGYGIHYPIPLPFVKAYLYKGYEKGDFPVAERLSKEILSLPVFPEISEEQVKFVASVVNEMG